jgi:DNA-binding transcriptional regulator YhcF (GntR family)
MNGRETILGALTQRDMADILAMTPETVTRIFKILEREGVIQKKNGWIRLSRDP